MAHAKISVDKVICIVRNPLDVYPSLVGLASTTSHSAVATVPWNQLRAWPSLVKFFTSMWVSYHTQLREQAKKTPVYFIRYEDLILKPAEVVSELFCFLLGQESISGTVLEQRIKLVCGQGHQGHEVYKLKSGAGKLNRNTHLYTEKQLAEIKEVCKDHF
jgi:hypothetical protein